MCTHLLTDSLKRSLTTTRLGNLLTSHCVNSELKQFTAEMGSKGDEEGGNAPVLRQTVQALPGLFP